jgi:hypothetical protein
MIFQIKLAPDLVLLDSLAASQLLLVSRSVEPMSVVEGPAPAEAACGLEFVEVS